ncbi:TlyA family RNA methyltransferase [Thermodesulfobacterium thermophilum]|uniref:TlyA family RNA methyltransferase n=1 Tax=Thermodesulfobacterium thermophilum TaxID=886 RepID=UPI0003B331BA|nr:TlyA family RNA methyltransferase [Thermodesulfobacterium thermophilum]
MKQHKLRADKLLVEKGLAETREKAQALIMAGKVWWSKDEKNWIRVEKPGQTLSCEVFLRVDEPIPYVSRGGLKLEGALEAFQIDVTGFVCLDIGASTGGFTHCLLLKGAKKVYTVDVGKGQLHPLLRNDPRVIPKEEINARYLTPEMFPEKMDLITIDVSFISLKKILPVTPPLLKPEGKVLALIKPQFEVGPKLLKKGVVKDPWVHKKVVDEIWDFSISLGFLPLGVAQSPILGPKGNKEFFILLGLHT